MHNKTGSLSSSTNYPFRCFVTHKKYAVLKTFFCQRMCTGDLDCFFVIFPLPLKYSVWLFEPLRTHCTGPFPKIRHVLPFHTICSALFTNNFLMRKAQYCLLLRGLLLHWALSTLDPDKSSRLLLLMTVSASTSTRNLIISKAQLIKKN